jgi:SNF2 family DNA or RNA helicase
LEAPQEFFEIFEQENESTKGNSMKSFGKKERHFKLSNNKKMKLSEAAFALLQWAEHGDVPEFTPAVDKAPSDTKQSDQETSNEQSGDEEELTSLVVLQEDEMDTELADDDDEATNQFPGILATTSNETASLPEMEDPSGFKDGVVLRSYQRQALHWMMNREHNERQREETERELNLLQELVPKKSKPPTDASDWAGDSSDDVRCECSPVIVSEAAAKKAMTLEGEVNPVNHPLWRRRFLTSIDKDVVILFYVNELLGTATYKPPNPPRQCIGGILADSMGLGKTVMLLALILKEKEEAAKNKCETGPTLIVAPLSLVAQWEEELATKTNLTHSVHYGDRTRSTFDSSNQLEVDVVITTCKLF